MPTQVQFRRGTTAQNNSFTGAAGEVSIDTDKDALRIHDGVVAGGFEQARADLSNHNGVGVLTATTFSGNVTGNLTGNVNSSGISTLNNVVVGGATTALVVNGNARVTGILTVGTSSLTLDGINDRITVGTGLTITSTEIIIGSITIGSGSLTGTATSTTNIPNLTGAITSSNTTTSLGSFSSANLSSALTDKTGTGVAVFATSPTLVTPALGTPSSGNLTNCTFPTLNQNTTGNAATVTTNANLTGHVTSVGNAAVLGSFSSANLSAALTDETGSGSAVFATSPTLVTPVLGNATATSVNASGIVTAAQFVTGASGSAIGINTNTISGPATLTIDPAAVGNNTGLVVIKGDLQIDGTTTTVNSTTVTVDDKNIVLGSGAANDAAADGSGITIESGNGNKTFQFEDTGDNLGSSENLNVASGKVYKVNNTSVLSSTTLGSGVINSSLTSVGTLTNLNVGNVNSSGIITATTFVGALTGTATSTTNIPNLTGDITSVNKATTLATVNSNVGTFGSGGAIPTITVNAKGLVTGVTTTAVNPANDGTLTLAVSGTGLSGSASFTANQSGSSSFTVTSNATNANTASAIVARDASGNFSAGTITASLTGTATSTTNIPNLTGAITSVNTTTSLGSFTSLQLLTALTDETGSGSAVFATSPTLVTPVLGTPSSGTLTNCTSLPISGLTASTSTALGVGSIELGHATDTTISRVSAGVVAIEGVNIVTTSSTDTLTNKTLTSPTLTTPALGTPSSGTLTSCTGLPVSTGISGLAANVATFLATPSSANLAAALTDETGTGANVFATSPTLVTPALGTPSSGTLTSCTGLPLTTGVTGTLPVANGGTGITALGTGVATFLATPSSANLAAALTDETGSGANVFATSPTLVTPVLGAATATSVVVGSGVTINASGIVASAGIITATTFVGALTGTASNVTTNANLTGHVTSVGNAAVLGSFTSAQLATALTDETGTGANVFATSPTLVTPALGTPSSGTLTSCTGLPISGLTASTSTALGVGSIELGHASDTSITRVSAGLVAIEGVNIVTVSASQTLTNKTLTSPTLTTPALGTPSSGTLTSCTGLPLTTGVTGTLPVANGGTGVTVSTGTGSVVLSASPTFTGTVGAAAITATGDIAAANFNSTSDISLKDNIQTIVNPLDKIIKLNGVTFNWKENQKPSIGVIAQELEKVLPELVTQGDIKSVNYNGLIGVLIEAVKEQQKQIDELKAIIKNQ